MNNFIPPNPNQVGLAGKEHWVAGENRDEACPANTWTAPYPLWGVYNFDTIDDLMVFKLIMNSSLPKIVRLGYISYTALNILERIGIDPDRFGESERKRLMLAVAKEFVASHLMEEVSGFDSLIVLFEKSDENKKMLFSHTFIPAFARGIRQAFGRQKVSLEAHQYLLASAKLEALRGIDNNWIDLGQAIYGFKMFMEMLSNLKLSHDTPDGKIKSIIRSIQNHRT